MNIRGTPPVTFHFLKSKGDGPRTFKLKFTVFNLSFHTPFPFAFPVQKKTPLTPVNFYFSNLPIAGFPFSPQLTPLARSSIEQNWNKSITFRYRSAKRSTKFQCLTFIFRTPNYHTPPYLLDPTTHSNRLPALRLA